MNINNAFPSKYLKSGDIEDADLILTITEVVQETVGQGEDAESKPIVYFAETEKGMVLNKTNANAIAGMYGPETDGWAGKRIALFATEVDFAGKQTLALRVRLKAPKPNGTAPTAAPLTLVQAIALLEANGLDKDSLKAAMKAEGRVNAEGQPAYQIDRDSELVRRLVAANTTPQPKDDELPF